MQGLSFLDKFALKLGIEKQSDWYRITSSALRNEGGSHLLKQHNGSVLKLLEAYYPQYEWKQWQFSSIPMHFWNDTKNHRKYMDWLTTQLGIHKKEDWYDVSPNTIRENHGTVLLSQYKNSMLSLLRSVYPEEDWHPWMFNGLSRQYFSTLKNQVDFRFTFSYY
jgi:hypothetical protein